MIKSIVVGLKPFDLSVGKIVHTDDTHSERSYVIIGDINDIGHLRKLRVLCIASTSPHAAWAVGKESDIFLGDLGVPGHAYDNRPCCLFRSKLAAVASAGVYWAWWANESRRDVGWYSYDDWRSFDSHHDHH